MVLVSTKLHAPGVRRGMLSRDTLVVRLGAGVGSRLVLLCAPAGWGKSELLAQWSKADPRPFAWLSLDPDDDDPVRFWSYVIAAVRSLAPDFGGALLGALSNAGPRLIDSVMPRLINELAELPEPLVLVLDDYHLIQDELIHASVAYLLRHAPRGFQLVLATRVDPPLPLARLRAAGELVDVRADELQFDGSETDALLNGALALELEPPDVDLLQERTEGWPAGLQLAALSLRNRSDRSAFIRSFAGDDRQVGDYLQEVIESASPPLREFLLRTSVLERMCAPLCEAVVGPDAGRLLGEAFRSNLFIVGLDDRGHWFRYHHLLRDLLRSELSRAAPQLVGELHSRAYEWHLAQGDLDEAIAHATAAGRVDDARELIALNWHAAWHWNPATVARWIDSLPPGALEGDARVLLARGWALVFSGRPDEVESLVAAAMTAPVPGEPRDEIGSVTTKAAILRACVAYQRGDLEQVQALARFAADDGPAPAGEALSQMMIGLAGLFRGQGAAVAAAFERSRALSGVAWRQVFLTSLAALTTIRAEAGDLAAAERLQAEADALMAEHGFEESPTASLAYSARGMVLELRSDTAGALAAYARAAELARRDGWPLDLVHAAVLQAQLLRRGKDIAGARALAREARAAVATCPDPGALPERVEKLERVLQLVASAAPAAAPDGLEPLSDRELAVLRLLATDLSQREIGAQLFVSFNTVKSHTRTVFRKLGVASRADAVEKAREQGLL